jgi:cytochrome c oxidase subunit 1
MTIIIKTKFLTFSFTSFISSMIGTVFIIVSPFIGDSEPVKNDYIPILHNLTFILGISLFLTGVLLQAILSILSFSDVKNDPLKFTIYMNSLIFIVATICLIKSALELQIISKTRFIDLLEYYQLLFWGAGHVLQFCYIQLVVFVWLNIGAPHGAFKHKFIINLQWLNFILILPSIAIYFLYPLDSAELYNFFTLHMKYTGGVLAISIAILVCHSIIKSNRNQQLMLDFTVFSCSVFLILSGGIIGYLISGANVTIPAHYHGVILGITVGLMGLFYSIIPQMGFRQVNTKHATWQILLYTTGQFIHILALAISGGYGVLRKSPGTELSLKAKLFMGAMGIGGSIALIGGVLFIVLIFKNLKEAKHGIETN